MQVKNGALHQRTSSDGAALYPTVPSKKGSYSKTVTSCRQCKGGTSRLVLEHSREKDTVRDSEEKEGKQDILYSWTRAREIHCDEFTKRGAISMASFSLKQLSIGFPLEELPPLLPSACAATMRTTWSLFSALRGG